MANRMKEDEKNERIIRGLLKLPANRRCMNCNSLGPQYVCTNFWTFICTACSGIHREFTHRVKSVSMAKFTSQEVSALHAGGNERAKEVYLKDWDPYRHSLPDGSNVERLRDFIKHVYVDRRYTGERSNDRLPRGEKDGYNDNRAGDRNFKYAYDEKRSPGYDQETRRYGDYGRSPGRLDTLDDRHREERFGNGNANRSGEQKSTDVASKSDTRSPDHSKVISSPPVVRPVREILGDNVPPLRVGDPPKANNGSNATNIPTHAQRTVSSSSIGSSEGNSVDLKSLNSAILIDLDAEPEPPVPAPAKDQFVSQPVTQPTATSAVDGNWASFDFVAQEKAPQTPSSFKTMEALSQLAVASTAGGNNSILHVTDPLVTSFGAQWATTMPQDQSSLLTSIGRQSAPQQLTPVGGAFVNQPWGSLAANAQGLANAPPIISQPPQAVPLTSQPQQVAPLTTQPSQVASLTAQPSQAAPIRPGEMRNVVQSQEVSAEPKPSGRKELPADLFAATYAPAPMPFQAWQIGPPRGMGYGFHYPNAMSMPTFPQPSKSTNPFDLTGEPSLVNATFPSMSSLQGVLPNVGNPRTLMRASSFGTPPMPWIPPQTPSYPTGMPPSAYPMQQGPANSLALGYQGAGGFSNDGSFFTASGEQHGGPRFTGPPPSNSVPFGGNPFG